MADRLSDIFTDRLIKSDLIKFVTKFDSFIDKGNEYLFTAKLSGKNKIKFAVDRDGEVYFIPIGKFRLLINDNHDLNKMLNNGMESISNKTKPDKFYMSLFRFMINIAKYIDNNNEGYTIPYVQQSRIKDDFRILMVKLDGYYKTKEYRDIINRGNTKYVF